MQTLSKGNITKYFNQKFNRTLDLWKKADPMQKFTTLVKNLVLLNLTLLI